MLTQEFILETLEKLSKDTSQPQATRKKAREAFKKTRKLKESKNGKSKSFRTDNS